MIMNRIKSGLFIFILSVWQYSSYAQVTTLPDGVMGTKAYINDIINNYADENAFSFDLNTTDSVVKIPLRLNIVRNIKGEAGVSVENIENSLSVANSYFKNIGIQFFIDSVNYVNDYNYSYITYNSNKTELLNLYRLTDHVNLFLVDSINMGTYQTLTPGRTTYGFTYFPVYKDSNVIFLDKEYASGKYLTTMLGHFMGLLATHDTVGGIEQVSEKNCDKSGDFICDTYADPNLYSQVDSTCAYTGSAKDGNGKYYVPTVANLMSDSQDNCKCIFTPLQYRRMYYYYRKYRQYLKN